MAVTGYAGEEGRLQARVDVNGSGRATVETGIPVLDHLLRLLAEHASFDITLEVAPGRRAAAPAGERRAMAAEAKSVVRTEEAPGPFQGAPYSQAIRAAGVVFVSGQLGLKPGDGEISGSISEQTEQIFVNLRA